jgi:putative transposase
VRASTLTENLAQWGVRPLTQAVEAEVAEFLIKHADTQGRGWPSARRAPGRQREIMTGIGPVAVRQPCMRDQETSAGDPERIRFTPAILPPCARRWKSLEMLIPIRNLKGVSTGDFVRLSLL